jgi:hypothetical protein
VRSPMGFALFVARLPMADAEMVGDEGSTYAGDEAAYLLRAVVALARTAIRGRVNRPRIQGPKGCAVLRLVR